jgi:hypothetical protein
MTINGKAYLTVKGRICTGPLFALLFLSPVFPKPPQIAS